MWCSVTRRSAWHRAAAPGWLPPEGLEGLVGAETVPGYHHRYHLVAFDAAGSERPEPTGRYSRTLMAQIAHEEPTDVFLLSHGWNGDLPAARRQYGSWVAAMAGCPEDRAAAEARPGGFRPVVVALHWPSKAWGEEDLESASYALPGDAPGTSEGGHADSMAQLVHSSVGALADTAAVRDAVCTIVDSALDDPVPTALPPPVREAYQRLDAELGRGADGAGAAPGNDRASFDPEGVYQAC